ncbi:MAG: prepilin peptidase [Bdellovibrionaceae bacterium]|nr:prepilin peptidase [Pseudobdellovibrionaceae bacterium]
MDIYMVYVFILGLIWGSFANVVIYRLPLNKSVIKPRSACPGCKKNISWYDNIPVFSWIFLKAACRHCKKKISIRYPIVELLMATLFTSVYLKFGIQWYLIELLVLTFGLVVVSFIDLDHMIIPDSFSLGGIVIGLLGGLLNPDRHILDAFLGILFGGGFFWLTAYLYFVFKKQEGLGGGDIKLLAWIGAVLGWKAMPFIILVSSFVGLLFGVLTLLLNKKKLSQPIPFGPYIVIAAFLYLFYGTPLTQWYFNLFFMNFI